jgi:hypothetical protein
MLKIRSLPKNVPPMFRDHALPDSSPQLASNAGFGPATCQVLVWRLSWTKACGLGQATGKPTACVPCILHPF